MKKAKISKCIGLLGLVMAFALLPVTVSAAVQSLYWDVAVTNPPAITEGGAYVLTISGSVVFVRELTVPEGATVTVRGDAVVSNRLYINIRENATVYWEANLSGANVWNSSAILGTGTLNIVGGSFTNTDRTVFTPNAFRIALYVNAPVTVNISGGTFESESVLPLARAIRVGGGGTVNITGNPEIIALGNEIAVYNGTVNIDTDLTISSGILINDTGTLNIGATLTNTGTINNAGTINNNGAINNYGTVTNNGTISNAGGGTFGGPNPIVGGTIIEHTPPTGIADITWTMAAMFALLGASAVLWGYVLVQRRKLRGSNA